MRAVADKQLTVADIIDARPKGDGCTAANIQSAIEEICAAGEGCVAVLQVHGAGARRGAGRGVAGIGVCQHHALAHGQGRAGTVNLHAAIQIIDVAGTGRARGGGAGGGRGILELQGIVVHSAFLAQRSGRINRYRNKSAGRGVSEIVQLAGGGAAQPGGVINAPGHRIGRTIGCAVIAGGELKRAATAI